MRLDQKEMPTWFWLRWAPLVCRAGGSPLFGARWAEMQVTAIWAAWQVGWGAGDQVRYRQDTPTQPQPKWNNPRHHPPITLRLILPATSQSAGCPVQAGAPLRHPIPAAAQSCGPLGCCNELAAFPQQVGPPLRNNARDWPGAPHPTLLLLTDTPSCRRPCLFCCQAWPSKDGPDMQRW
jgi:hypothetical protein